MHFAMLRAFERYDADYLPSLHRLLLVALADLADERARVPLDDATVQLLTRRTGIGAREVRTVLAELQVSVWLERDPRSPVHDGGYAPKPPAQPVHDGGYAPKPPAPPAIAFVRLEGGRIHRRRRSSDPVTMGGDPPYPLPEPAPESPATRPAPAVKAAVPLTVQALMQQRPADDLLGVLARGAENGHTWCVAALQRVLERGGRLTDRERKTLREIDGESVKSRGPTRRRGAATSTLQAGGTWKPKGAPP